MTELDYLRVFFEEAVAWGAKQWDQGATSPSDIDQLMTLASQVYGQDLKRSVAQVAPAPAQVAPSPAPVAAAA